jgi:hypothetical protein
MGLSATALFACFATAQASWQPQPGFTSRFGAAAAYDAARGVTILFGGNDGVRRDDTWQWDGTNLTLLQPANRPPARADHTMCYDSLRQRVLLCGGAPVSGSASDLWSWDGSDWTRIQTAHSPTSYIRVLLAYDAARDRVVHLGAPSYSDAYPGLWEFDGTDWVQFPIVTSNWPLSNADPLFAYDGAAGNTALCKTGGSTTYMWRWNGTAWSRETGPGFNTMTGARMVYDPAQQALLLVSGTSSLSTGTLHRWQPASRTWVSLATTGPVTQRHAYAYDTSRNRLVVVGGMPNGTPADSSLFEWTGSNWSRRTYAPPYPRTGHRMVYDRANDRLVLYGGSSITGTVSDTWVWDDGHWVLAVPQGTVSSPPNPGQLTGVALAHDEARGITLLHGDGVGTGTWLLQNNQWTEVAQAGPSPRQSPGLVFDRRRARIVLFGGRRSATNLDDQWHWDGTAWTQQFPLHRPSPRYSAGIAYDAARDRIVLVGGSMTAGIPNDTWEFDGTDWSVQSGGLLPVGNAPTLVYDEAREITLGAFPQSNGTMPTWQWDGQDWSPFSPAVVPPARREATLVNTAAGVRLDGGDMPWPAPSGSYLSEPWLLASPTLAQRSAFGLPGQTGAGPLELRGVGALPWIGSDLEFEFGLLPGVPLPGLWFGFSQHAWSGQPLPLNLAGLGFPGTMLRISLDLPWPVLNNGQGLAKASIALPALPELVGMQVFCQAFVYEPATAGLTTSNGLVLTLGLRG